MNVLERGVRRIDAFQQGHLVPGFVIGLVKKYGDDNGGALAARLTFAMFTTVFPLILLLVTILALVLAGDPRAREAVLHSTFAQFPLVGNQLGSNIHAMRRNSAFGLVVGLVGLVYGLRGIAGTGLDVMEQVWNLPMAIRPNFWVRTARSFVFLAVLAVGLVVTTFLSSFGTFGRHNFWLGVLAEVLAGIVNVALYLSAFRVLTPKQVETRCLVPGCAVAGVLWTVLQAAGGYVVGHYLRSDNAVYGTFGTVLGLIAWIGIGAQVTVYAAELNTLLARRLWPRGIVQPPLTAADQEMIATYGIEAQRRPEQEIRTRVRGRPMTQREYLQNGGSIDHCEIGAAKQIPEDPAPPADVRPSPSSASG